MKQQMQGFSCTAAHRLGVETGVCHDALEVTLGIGQPFPYAIELRQNAHLHFLRRLVGERHGEDVAVVRRVFYK